MFHHVGLSCFRILPARVLPNFQFLANTNSFSISEDLPTLNISYQLIQHVSVCVLSCFVFLIEITVLRFLFPTLIFPVLGLLMLPSWPSFLSVFVVILNGLFYLHEIHCGWVSALTSDFSFSFSPNARPNHSATPGSGDKRLSLPCQKAWAPSNLSVHLQMESVTQMQSSERLKTQINLHSWCGSFAGLGPLPLSSFFYLGNKELTFRGVLESDHVVHINCSAHSITNQSPTSYINFLFVLSGRLPQMQWLKPQIDPLTLPEGRSLHGVSQG